MSPCCEAMNARVTPEHRGWAERGRVGGDSVHGIAIGTGKVFRSGHDDLSATGGHHGASQRCLSIAAVCLTPYLGLAQQPPPQAPHLSSPSRVPARARGAIWGSGGRG